MDIVHAILVFFLANLTFHFLSFVFIRNHIITPKVQLSDILYAQ